MCAAFISVDRCPGCHKTKNVMRWNRSTRQMNAKLCSARVVKAEGESVRKIERKGDRGSYMEYLGLGPGDKRHTCGGVEWCSWPTNIFFSSLNSYLYDTLRVVCAIIDTGHSRTKEFTGVASLSPKKKPSSPSSSSPSTATKLWTETVCGISNECVWREKEKEKEKERNRERAGGGGAVKRNEENNALNRNRFSAVGVVVSLAAARFGQLSFFPFFSFVSIYLIISSKPIRRGFNSRHRQGRTRESQLNFFGGVRVCVCVDCVMFLPRHLGFL